MVKRNRLFLASACCLLFFSCGCVLKMGGVSPTWGRSEGTFSSGAELRLPLMTPEKVGDHGWQFVIPFEEYRTPVEHSALFSKGTLRTSTLGGEIRLVYLLYLKDTPGKEAAPYDKEDIDVAVEEPKLHKHRDKTKFFIWFGLGSEYRWNNFVVATSDLNAAAANNIFYDEEYNNGWGNRLSFGFQTSTYTHDNETGEATGGIGLQMEISYHFGKLHMTQFGTDNTILFRKTREDPFEWLSLYTGLVFEF